MCCRIRLRLVNYFLQLFSVCVCVCWVWVIERKGGKIELKRERERAECGRLLSAASHAATQASIQTWPIHCPYGPLQCLVCSVV